MKKAMLVAVDIGNTNTVFGVFKGARLLHVLRMETDVSLRLSELITNLQKLFQTEHVAVRNIRHIVMASVVPGLSDILQDALKKICRASIMHVTSHCTTGITIDIDNKQELGADRLVNAVAACRHTRGSAIVVDFGTAVTFDCIKKNGRYVGGIIMPGPGLAAQSLADHTAQLPLVAFTKPRTVIGRNTIQCIRAGLFYGYSDMTEGLLRRLKKKLPKPVTVFATGGLAPVFGKYITGIDRVIPWLTLDGLRHVWEMNHD
ncbi:MAG: type III pantothenate kinase [Elusimicrobia bacterium]|nr:type III pantothenate kinase [Elusimicrobiota bacterium]MBD3411552.1 type III pantothenate kinase [Elusimicrobiota bacterium]